MTKIARFVFETAFGPFVAWCCASLFCVNPRHSALSPRYAADRRFARLLA